MLIRFSIAALTFGLFFATACNIFSGEVSHKSDAELIVNLQNHKAEFNRLLEMVKEDKGLMRVDYDWTRPKHPNTIGVSDERIKEYRRIFKELKIPRGFYAFHDSNTYSFMASAQGIAVSGSSKGYIWTTEPCKYITNDTDTYFDERRKNYQNLSDEQKNISVVCRHIEGNWYLFYDWD